MNGAIPMERILACSLVLGFVLALAEPSRATPALIEVAVESSFGAGDFDDNVLGVIESFETTLVDEPSCTCGTTCTATCKCTAICKYYGWDGSTPARYSFELAAEEDGPDLVASRAHLFFVATEEELALFHVFDDFESTGGGTADSKYELSGASALDAMILAEDEPWNFAGSSGVDYYTEVRDLQLPLLTVTADHQWQGFRTDGLAIGPLEGADWSMLVSFTTTTPLNMTSWHAVDTDGSSLEILDFTTDDYRRRVRLPEPGAIHAAIPATLLLRRLARRRRRQCGRTEKSG
jgi:hypothetical protein